MKSAYTKHFLNQIKERRISKKLAKEIYIKAEERYLDTVSNHKIAIHQVEHLKKRKKIMIAYDIINGEVYFITSYPVKEKEVMKRLARKRWIYEAN